MEVVPTLQLTTTKLATYVRPYAERCLDARLTSRDVAARFIDKTAYQTAFTFRLLQADQSAVSEWVSSFLTAHQHNIGYAVPYY